jgi:hypothetical protein
MLEDVMSDVLLRRNFFEKFSFLTQLVVRRCPVSVSGAAGVKMERSFTSGLL